MANVDRIKVLAATFLSTAPASTIFSIFSVAPQKLLQGMSQMDQPSWSNLKWSARLAQSVSHSKAGCEKRDATSAKRLLRRGQETGNCNVFESASAFVGLNDTHKWDLHCCINVPPFNLSSSRLFVSNKVLANRSNSPHLDPATICKMSDISIGTNKIRIHRCMVCGSLIDESFQCSTYAPGLLQRQQSYHFSPPARWGLLDFIRAVLLLLRLLLLILLVLLLLAVQIPVGTAGPQPLGTAGPQPRVADRTGHCRTSTASSRSQWALPDLNRELQIPVGTAGP